MSVSKKIIFGQSLFALGLILSGCNTGDRNPAEAGAGNPVGTTDLQGSSEFDRQLIAAKHSSSDPAIQEQAILDVLTKFNVSHASPFPNSLPTPGPITDGSAAQGAGAQGAGTQGAMASGAGPQSGLAKTASVASSFAPIIRELGADNDIHTFYKSVTVPANGVLNVTAVGVEAGTDPFLVAFYRNDGSSGTTAYSVQVVGYNDDISGSNRNSQFNFANGPTSRKVEIVAFSYSGSTRGSVNVGITINGALSTFSSRWLGGLAQYGGNNTPTVPTNCFNPLTRMTETNVAQGGFSAAALLVDTRTLKGGIIWDVPGTSQILGLDSQINNSYPSFALFMEAITARVGTLSEEASAYKYKQQDVYSCVR